MTTCYYPMPNWLEESFKLYNQDFYNEELNVRACRDTVRRIFQAELPNYDYEHIFCDNASKDGHRRAILRELAGEDPHVKVILNSRNFGPFRSLFNGILATSGDAVCASSRPTSRTRPKCCRKW